MATRRISFFCLILLTTQNIFATQPLYDQLTYQGYTGYIFPSECCWLKKPRSKKLDKIQKDNIEKRSCSAIGGPVSKLKLENNKLYLTSLYQCGGDLPLSDVYPKLKQPALATWLTGTYKVKLNEICLTKGYNSVYEFHHTLIVKEGILTSISTTKNDKSTCHIFPST